MSGTVDHPLFPNLSPFTFRHVRFRRRRGRSSIIHGLRSWGVSRIVFRIVLLYLQSLVWVQIADGAPWQQAQLSHVFLFSRLPPAQGPTASSEDLYVNDAEPFAQNSFTAKGGIRGSSTESDCFSVCTGRSDLRDYIPCRFRHLLNSEDLSDRRHRNIEKSALWRISIFRQ